MRRSRLAARTSGPTVGLGNLGTANVSIGGRFEQNFKKLHDLGNGLPDIGVRTDVYGYDAGVGSLRFFPIGATSNYHFTLDPKNKLDLFLGAGLRFSFFSCSGFNGVQPLRVASTMPVSASVASPAPASSCGTLNSNLYFIRHAGGRYFLKPNPGLSGDVGAGAATLNPGLTVKLLSQVRAAGHENQNGERCTTHRPPSSIATDGSVRVTLLRSRGPIPGTEISKRSRSTSP